MSGKRVYTQSQQNVIDYRGDKMLVSASAGTGKTTVMIERIAALLGEGVDVSEIVVVTFTNLAAAEMKNRLAVKLAEKRGNERLIDQLERLDGASISTLHSFCSELLRNYFYVVDIDPSFTILDSNLTSTLRKNALDELFLDYYANKDELFKRVYRIFSRARQEENFKKVILDIYGFSRCIEDFSAWYALKRVNLQEYSDGNPLVVTILNDIKQSVDFYARRMEGLSRRSDAQNLTFSDIFAENAELLRDVAKGSNLEEVMFNLCKLSLNRLPPRNKKADFGVDKDIEEQIRVNYEDLKGDIEKYIGRYAELCRGEKVQTLWSETQKTLEYLDKLVEIVVKFDEIYYRMKKERGGVDFNDLEHLTLRLLRDGETLSAIQARYKYIFVDEYQDTNPVQEAIISALAQHGNLFMVGDVKQSIYGFRGCEPTIFVDKYNAFKATDCGRVEELNDNFRSNCEILDFVNAVFGSLMTTDFGKVNYRDDAQLRGEAKPILKRASSRVDIIVSSRKEQREIDELYDITKDDNDDVDVNQGELIAKRIKEYVGMAYKDKNGVSQRIGYGDIVILMRSLTDKAIDIYNTLISHNIPAVANFKADSYSSKEVKDVINLLRVLDNPYNDVYLVGVCLSPFGNFTESELGIIRLDTEGRIPFYDRLKNYAKSGSNSAIKAKIDTLTNLLVQLRFYSRSASVSEVTLKAMQLTKYQLYVQGLPNGGLRMRKLYSFVDGVKDASYADSIDKFLSYIDETDDNREEGGAAQSNAVRIMTMHASKGLEFPIVIIAGLETQFLFDNPSVVHNFDLGLAMRYYDFGTMRFANTLSYTACGMFNKTKQREEEMRLLYVAMTRAQYALDMVGVVDEKQLVSMSKLPSKANSHLDWIFKILKERYKTIRDVAGDKWEINVITGIIDNSPDVKQDYLCPQETDARKVADTLAYEYEYQAQTEMPSKVVSSALDKSYIDMGDQAEHVLNADDDRNFVGTAYHKVYQYIDYNADAEQIRATIDGLVNDGKIERRYADKLDVELILSTLNNVELRKIMASGDVYHEMPFMLLAPYDKIAKDKRFSDDTILQGVIDLLVIGDNSATVVDFKYTSRSDKAAENYKAQLNSYKLAVRQICGIDDVTCYILSIADNELIKM